MSPEYKSCWSGDFRPHAALLSFGLQYALEQKHA
jgi:hypothetical protein